MSRNDLWKWLALVAVAILSVYVTYPPTGPNGKIRLGLDLSGGTSFTLAIDQARLTDSIKAAHPELDEAAIQARVNESLRDADARAIQVIRRRIDGLGVNEPVIQGAKNHRVIVQLPGIDDAQRKAAEESLQSAAFLEFKLVVPDNVMRVDKLLSDGRAPDGYALAEDGRSYVRTAEYAQFVQKPGFRERQAVFGVTDPQRTMFMLSKSDAGTYEPYFVRRAAELTGDALAKAEVQNDLTTGRVTVGFTLKNGSAGSVKFAKLTRDYQPNGTKNRGNSTGRQLAIVLDDVLYSAPVINSEIPNGRGEISGNFSRSEAQSLVNVLNSGALPAPMKMLEKRSVGSSLGDDAITSGVRAAVIGTALVGLFMLIYYMYCGLIANIAIVLDLLLLPAGLILASNLLGLFAKDAILGGGGKTLPVLTMPGIAGIVLTLGMAVDANVLIFERMREEFAAGNRSRRGAVNAGFSRAFLAIFDSNITTLLTGAILFIVGAGPIRGYAITLTAGILVSMFTALVVTRLIFNATTKDGAGAEKPYRMLTFMKDANFQFLKYGKMTCLTSLAIIVLTMGLFFGRAFTKPSSVMAVDFTGGAAMTFTFDAAHKADVAKIREVAAGVVNDAKIQYESPLDGSSESLLIKTSETEVKGVATSKALTAALQEKLPDCKFQLAGEEEVGSEIGADLKRSATWAVILSLIGILAYVSLRFEFGFALGGVVALAHDAFITLGLFSLTGRQLSLTVVAALLTIVGYSINDTIVIFDRIREDLRKDPKLDFPTLCTRAMNQTLSRTILTSLSTLIAALSLFVFGGGAINDFAFAMLIGLFAGTYSTLFIATPVMMMWYRGRRPKFASSEK